MPRTPEQLTLVLDSYACQILTTRDGRQPGATVEVSTDERSVWSGRLDLWGSLSVGVAGDVAYFWSEHTLVTWSIHASFANRYDIPEDEIRSVYRVPTGWLIVAETSVHFWVDDGVRTVVHLGEVVLTARWEADSSLLLGLFDGSRVRVQVVGDELRADVA